MALSIFAAQCNARGLSDQGAQKNNSAPNPNSLFLYYPGKGGIIGPSSEFSMCTLLDDGDPKPLLGSLLPTGRDDVKTMGLLDVKRNPTMPLSHFSMSRWYDLCKKDSNLYDFASLCVYNFGKIPLKVTLPSYISMPLFIFGDRLVLENDVKAEWVYMGFDARKIGAGLISGLTCYYSDCIFPSTITVNGDIQGTIGYCIAQSEVTFNGSLPKKLRLYHSRINVANTQKNSLIPRGSYIEFYGDCRMDFKTTTVIDGDVSLGNEDEPFRSELTIQPNNSIARLNNVYFQPKAIIFGLPVIPTKGFFDIKGRVDLDHTCIRLMWCQLGRVYPDMLERRILMIRSDRPICGIPFVKIQGGFTHNLGLQARIEIEQNNAYVILSAIESKPTSSESCAH